MEIKHSFPPNISEIRMAFPIQRGTVFAYGNTLYVPSGLEVPGDIMVHEEVHSQRQGEAPEMWWTRYLLDEDFRFEEELAAYAAQYAWIKKKYPSNAHKPAPFELAENLCNPLYKLGIPYNVAETAIRRRSKELA